MTAIFNKERIAPAYPNAARRAEWVPTPLERSKARLARAGVARRRVE
jgi:hypothetical protein